MINIHTFLLESISTGVSSDADRKKIEKFLTTLCADVKKSNDLFGQFAESFYNTFKAGGFGDKDVPVYIAKDSNLKVPNNYPEYYGFYTVLISFKEGEPSLSNLNTDEIDWVAFGEPWVDAKGMDVNVITHGKGWYAEGEAFKLENRNDYIDICKTVKTIGRRVENEFTVSGSDHVLAVVFQSM